MTECNSVLIELITATSEMMSIILVHPSEKEVDIHALCTI